MSDRSLADLVNAVQADSDLDENSSSGISASGTQIAENSASPLHRTSARSFSLKQGYEGPIKPVFTPKIEFYSKFWLAFPYILAAGVGCGIGIIAYLWIAFF